MEHRLAEIRERKGVKQAELARRVKLSRGQIANLEAGNRKMDLDVLRKCATALEVQLVDLLLPEDAPSYPTNEEAELLRELRATEGYDPKAVLTAARAVIAATSAIRTVQQAPRDLAGDPQLAAGVTKRWNELDDEGRKKALELFDTARDFSRR